VSVKVKSKLIEGFRSVVDNGRVHSIVLDLPREQGGGDTGPTALELCVMSLAGCISTIYAVVAEKAKLNVKHLEVLVEAEKSEEIGTITKAKIRVKVKTPDPEEKARKVLELTLKNCPVGLLFERAGVELEHSIEVLK